MKAVGFDMKRVVVLLVLASALFVDVTIARRGSGAETGPTHNEIFAGVTAAMGQGGSNPLCIGRSVDDPHTTCAPVEYPGRKPGCVFLFKQTGGQKITARLAGGPVWQPVTLDGHTLNC